MAQYTTRDASIRVSYPFPPPSNLVGYARPVLHELAPVPGLHAACRGIGRLTLRVSSQRRGSEQLDFEFSDWQARRVLRGGRSPINDITLSDDDLVLATHFELVIAKDRILLRDLDDTRDRPRDDPGGVFLGGSCVREAWIGRGAEFRVGDTSVEILALDIVDMTLPLIDHFGELYGRSTAMRGLFARFAHMTERGDQSNVLVRGEAGTGRQLLARVLHASSARSHRPFVVLDCASVAPELLASHLFGRGCADAPGRFDVCGGLEAAHGGTLLLKAIDRLPAALQNKLLTVVQRGVLTREGEQHTRKFDARLICATDRDIQRLVAEGEFNADLYNHLMGVQVELPALRERDDDVAFLATEVFLKRLCDDTGRTRRLTPEALDALRAHTWPQNLSELRCAVERAFYARDDEWIRPADLGLNVGATFHDGLLRKLVEIEALFTSNHNEAVAGFERLYFAHLLLSHPSKAKATRFSGMTNEGFRLALKRLRLGTRCAAGST